MTRVVVSSAHGKHVPGASGYIVEVEESRKVVEQVVADLRTAGVDVVMFHDDTSYSQTVNLETIVAFHNMQERDLDVSIHFNAHHPTSNPMGVEVLYLTDSALANSLCAAIADAGTFTNRGAKFRSDLYFLNETEQPAVLIELCFVDSYADTELYHKNFTAICRAIAEVLGGVLSPGV